MLMGMRPWEHEFKLMGLAYMQTQNVFKLLQILTEIFLVYRQTVSPLRESASFLQTIVIVNLKMHLSV